jgi:membrane protease YdiL (CAAX protease family)
MSTFIEPIILYAVLFFRLSAGAAPSEEFIEFSATAEVARIVIYNLPALALIWYLLLKSKGLKEWGIGLPGKNDILPAVLSLPALVLIGMTIATVSSYVGEIVSGPRFLPPQTGASWGILALSCLSTGYLEESYFRFYLLSKREEMGLGPHRAVLVSTLLFSFCHVYEGPWGFLNAALSGIVLSVIFFRFRSLHGIAIAHALYNILVFFVETVKEPVL